MMIIRRSIKIPIRLYNNPPPFHNPTATTMFTPNPKTTPFTVSTILILFLIITNLFFSCSDASQQQQPIKNVVVLVMENRSFDHMLGWMKKSINLSINGLDGTECNRKSTSDPNSPKVCVSDDALLVDPDPGHSFEEIKMQVFGSGLVPDMSGFVQQASMMKPELTNTVMRGFKPMDVPIYTSLVQEFAVFDRWFASIPTSTQPNRLYVYSATSHGTTSNDKFMLLKGFPQKTIFDSLHDNGLDFGIYSQSIPTTLFFRNLRKLKYAVRNFHMFSTFFDHARQGKLKELTVIEPMYFDILGKKADDDHPSHDVGNGQRLVKQVYEALRASPQWNRSLLIITYDEHGGFYDHVVTPYVGVPSPDGIHGPGPAFFKFDRLGVRVPTIMVSPWIKKGTVISKPDGPTPTSEFEHSSIPATIKKIFNLKSDYLTHRDAWAGTFDHIFSGMTSPRTDCPEVLPYPRTLRPTAEASEKKMVSEFQSELVQLSAALAGEDHVVKLDSYSQEMSQKMTVKEADEYVNKAMSKFYQKNMEAYKSQVDESSIIDMRSQP